MKLLEELSNTLSNPEKVRSFGNELAQAQGKQQGHAQIQAQGKRVRTEIYKLLKMAGVLNISSPEARSQALDSFFGELKQQMLRKS